MKVMKILKMVGFPIMVRGSRFINNGSSHRRCSIEKGVLKNLTKFSRKHLCQSLFFNKVAGLKPYDRFPVDFPKFLRTPFITEQPWTTASEMGWGYLPLCMLYQTIA